MIIRIRLTNWIDLVFSYHHHALPICDLVKSWQFTSSFFHLDLALILGTLQASLIALFLMGSLGDAGPQYDAKNHCSA
jgi:hypothetical protein